MFEVSFFKNGVEKTIADEFDTIEDARQWAECGLYEHAFSGYAYDEAHIYSAHDDVFEVVTRDEVA